jgi:hypothetical protein
MGPRQFRRLRIPRLRVLRRSWVESLFQQSRIFRQDLVARSQANFQFQDLQIVLGISDFLLQPGQHLGCLSFFANVKELVSPVDVGGDADLYPGPRRRAIGLVLVRVTGLLGLILLLELVEHLKGTTVFAAGHEQVHEREIRFLGEHGESSLRLGILE